MADELSSKDDAREDRNDRSDSSSATAVATARADRGGGGDGFFTIYKRGQGYWTRMGTAMGAALIAFLSGQFVYGRLQALSALYGWKLNPGAMFAISAAVFALLMLWAWRLMNRPTNADFLIATDSEMKKVNWTTRKELIGSTKVVCFFVVLISAILFGLDVIFGYLFYAIRVLEFRPF